MKKILTLVLVLCLWAVPVLADTIWQGGGSGATVPSTPGLVYTDAVNLYAVALGANYSIPQINGSGALVFSTSINIPYLQGGTLYCDPTTTTKCVQFVMSGITAANTRTVTYPDYNITVASLAGSEDLTNKTLSFNTLDATGGNPTVAQLHRGILNNWNQASSSLIVTLPGLVDGLSFMVECGKKLAQDFGITTTEGSNIYWDNNGTLTSGNSTVKMNNQAVGCRFTCKTIKTGISTIDLLCGGLSTVTCTYTAN